MQLAVGRAFVDAEVAAAGVLSGAQRQADELLALVGETVERLVAVVGEARTSVQAAARLPSTLAAYQSELARLSQALRVQERCERDAGVDGIARLAARQTVGDARPGSEA